MHFGGFRGAFEKARVDFIEQAVAARDFSFESPTRPKAALDASIAPSFGRVFRGIQKTSLSIQVVHGRL